MLDFRYISDQTIDTGINAKDILERKRNVSLLLLKLIFFAPSNHHNISLCSQVDQFDLNLNYFILNLSFFFANVIVIFFWVGLFPMENDIGVTSQRIPMINHFATFNVLQAMTAFILELLPLVCLNELICFLGVFI